MYSGLSRVGRYFCLLLVVLLVGGAQAGEAVAEPRFMQLQPSDSTAQLVAKLRQKRVVYIGERHDHYAHHLAQLAVIEALYRETPRLAIGMEMFQRPYQSVLDDYIAGRIDEEQMLKQSQWFDRWQFDYRLYRPILQFARENRIPVVALNLSKELVAEVSQKGLQGVSAEIRAQLPKEIVRGDPAYLERLRGVFEHHPESGKRDFERFVDVQLSWDETMAWSLARYLKQNPGHRMAVLAGDGHLAYGSGIPRRVQRRIAVESAILLPETGVFPDPAAADYLVLTGDEELPPKGVLGVYMEPAEGGVRVARLVEKGAAALAGVKQGDLLLEVNGRAIEQLDDVQIALLGKAPGDRVQLKLRHNRMLLGPVERQLQIALGK